MSGPLPASLPGTQLNPDNVGAAVGGWARVMALARRSLGGGNGDDLWQAWVGARNACVALCKENQRLREELDDERAASSAVPGRAPTTDTTVELREALEAQQLADAQLVHEQSVTVRTLRSLPAAWARDYLNRYVLPDAITDGLGCTMKPGGSRSEYVKVNLRNTNLPGGQPGQKIGYQPFLHQLVLVAEGKGELLARTTANPVGDPYEVSHLCHRRACFNPDHLVVEPRDLNRARNACQGLSKVIIRGVTYHPCAHWDDEHWYGPGRGQRKACILDGTVPLGDVYRGEYVEATRDGGVRIRPRGP